MSQRLSDVIMEYQRARESRGIKKNTLRNDRRTLDHLLAVVGNIQVGHITPDHVDKFFTAMQTKGHSAGTLNVHLSSLKAFFAYCTSRRLLRSVDPLAGRRWYKVAPKARLRVPRERFDYLLDCARHPRDRIIVALGLYLFLRQSEVATLRLSDLDLPDGELTVHVHKTTQLDVMPICSELDTELRRWLSWYHANTPRPLEPTDFLVPAKAPGSWKSTGQSQLVFVEGTEGPRPDAMLGRVQDHVKRVLVAAGYPVTDASGKSTFEGMHTLRRSGARALFDTLSDAGYDGALKLVSAYLHHSSVTMTEKYLGLDIDIQRRNDLHRGKRMYPAPVADNVHPLVAER